MSRPDRWPDNPRGHPSYPAVTVPASFAQEGLWILEQLFPEVALYSVPVVVRLLGEVDSSLLGACLSEVVRRHETLRSRIVAAAGGPVVVVDGPEPVEVTVTDVRAGTAVGDLVQAAARRPFELATGPLLRAELFRTGARESELFLDVHHAVFDGWSLGLLWQEVSALYAADVAGCAACLPELPLQYSHHAARERRRYAAGGFATELAYWERQLAGAPTFLQVDPGRRRPATRSHPGTFHRHPVPPELRRRILALAGRLAATPFMVTLAAWGALLARHARQYDLLIGSPASGRDRPDMENLIGLFVNTVVLRLRPEPAKRFADLVAEARLATLDALAHQALPFEKLVERMQVERTSSRSPLFQTMFSYDAVPALAPLAPGVRVASLSDVSTGAAKYDLSATVFDVAGEMEIQIEYDTELFDPGLVEHLGRQYLTLLGEVAGGPDQPIGRIRLLDDAERDAVLHRFAGSAAWPPSSATLHALFEDRAAREPGASAVAAGDRSMSYGVLNAAANRLANHLRSRGVAVQAPVGILLPTSPDWAVAVLAVLKAGAAYVPLDPGTPPERVRSILADSRAALVITDQDRAAKLPPDVPAVVVDAPGQRRALADQPEGNLGLAVHARHLAYVIYTSGSTGRPKGAMLPHASLVAFGLAAVASYRLGPRDRFLQLAPASFDVHAEEVFPTWLAGGTVVFPERAGAVMAPAELVELMSRRGITICELPAAYWYELVGALPFLGRRLPRRLRRVLVGGERLATGAYDQWRRHGVGLTNVYGLTETAITSTCWTAEGELGRESLPIGRTMGHAAVYVLDDLLVPVPVGVPGEICIGGPGVARGYLDMPALTGWRFVPDPFGRERGGRLYRTGDIGRWLPDGNLEFLGRADDQIKIRGARVDPGEVEAALEKHPRVGQAVVVADQAATGDLRLVAYVVGKSVEPAEVTRFLRARLPDYLVPAHVVLLGRLPRTPNGKIDKAALPGPAGAEPAGPVGPLRGPLESRLAGLWATVLDLPAVGPEDDFFALGGHSLLAVRLITEIQRVLGVEVSLADIFEGATVRGLSELIAAAPDEPEPAARSRDVPA